MTAKEELIEKYFLTTKNLVKKRRIINDLLYAPIQR